MHAKQTGGKLNKMSNKISEGLSKVLELLKMLDDNEKAIIVEVLHDEYRLTYIESEEDI